MHTGCPFNLQKPADWEWPKWPTLVSITGSDRPGGHHVTAPFCIANDLGDAARIFCEWIIHFRNVGNRRRLLSFSSNAREFARNLPLVGFGAPPPGQPPGSQGAEYARMVDTVSPFILFELIGGP